ncbi:glycine-rich domain-containing protein [Streptomyces sp. NPDC058734]|uniref:glycine-rich domain-containing protein n=1 Tax=Streptomyces sp. NPDC058734 TaxID=3346615 RepID=UPI00369B5255
MTITDTTKTVYDLITPELRADLITMIREDSWPEMTDAQGERGVDQMAAFLAVAANTTQKATPSLRVDLFWHAFVLHTKPYADFCEALAGRFIHHVPDRNSGHNPTEGRKAMRRTADMIRAAGFDTDPEYWPADNAADCSGDCSQSYAGCSDSPVAK